MDDIFEPTEEMRRGFESFLGLHFTRANAPTFRDEEEKNKAIQVWWVQEKLLRQTGEKIRTFRLAFRDLTGIG